MRKLLMLPVVFLLVLMMSGPSRADEINAKEILQKNRYELGVLAGYGWAMDNLPQEPNIQHAVVLPSLSITLSGKERGFSFLKGIIQYQLEPVIGIITVPNQRAEFGLSAVGFKYNFTALENRWLPYSSFGFGTIYEPIGHHVQGTNFNFILHTGLGVEYFLDEKHAINVQYRYRHISNACIKLPNSSINSSFVLVGLSFF
jgi:lipid A 3-O-deacylase